MFKALLDLLSLLDGLLDEYQRYRLKKTIEREVILEQRLNHLRHLEEAREIDSKPVPTDKHDIITGM
jgi:hypothetical protein